jgi:hypothetical protein
MICRQARPRAREVQIPMSKHDEAPLNTKCAPGDTAAVPAARRINVAVNAMMLSAIDRIIDREQVTMTEAVRRLIAYGDFVYEVTKVRDSTLVVRDPGGDEREVVVL